MDNQIVEILFLIVILAVIVIAAVWKWNHRDAPHAILGGAESEGGPPGGKAKDLERFPRSKSEAVIIELFEMITGREFPTVTPPWLRSKGGRCLELDGYCAELAIAIEFSGPQHTKWYSTRESYEAYFKRVSRDQYKIDTCRARGVTLIVIDMTISALHSGHRYHYVLSRLHDCGFIEERPIMYIDEQIILPFRNETLEAELNLVMGEIY